MDITSMRYFREVARTGNISKAAENLGITQPPLSRSLNTLQEEIGVQLFRRSAHGIALTQTGEEFYHAITKVIELTDSTINQFKNIGGSVDGTIRLACVEDIMTPHIADTLNSFMERNPLITLDFVTGEPAYVHSLIKDNKADIAISNFTVMEKDLQYIDFGLKRRLGIVVPNTNKYANATSVDLEWLKGRKLIAPKEKSFKAVLGEEIHNRYIKYNICATYDTPINYLNLIRDNERYLICFELSTEKLRSMNLVFCPIRPEITINVGLIFSSEIQTGDAAMLLVDYIRKAMTVNKKK